MRRPATSHDPSWDQLFHEGDDALTVEARVSWLQTQRLDPEKSLQLDACLLNRALALQQALRACGDEIGQMRGLLDRATASPWFPATFIRALSSSRGNLALVRQGSTDRIVGCLGDQDPLNLQTGQTVYLSADQNVILEPAEGELDPVGETCQFERHASDDRLIVKSRDEEIVVRAAGRLLGENLRPGELLRWSRAALIAWERLDRADGSHLFLEENPIETFEAIGGLGPQIRKITRSLELHLHHRDVVRLYGLRPLRSILLHGPAGTGKTLVAKGLANWLGRQSPHGRAFFMNLKPAALHSVWYSQSEANYREAFRAARETAVTHPGSPVVMFFDEVDSLGATRNDSPHRVHNNVLTAFLAELDGMAGRGDVLVVGATNRLDALDPALVRPGRLGDLVMEVPRPNRQAAFEILGKHLAARIPYATSSDGADLDATRNEILQAAVSRIFAPNGEGDLATLTFRDGKRRAVRAADLVNGATLANIARAAIERACERHIAAGLAGVTYEDLAVAIEREFTGAARNLTPANCRHHLSGLPYDLDVVNVERVRNHLPQRFLHSQSTD